MALTRIERDAGQRERAGKQKQRDRRRARALERSRRAANLAQYQLSKRQEKHAGRLAAAGRPPIEMIPKGPRNARVDGVPLQSYRRDALSSTYRRTRTEQARDAKATARARRDHARTVAAEVVATHGYQLVVEDVSIAAWAASWGAALAAFSPGTVVSAIDREARAVGALAGGEGGVVRAGTRSTALSQHCPCGARVSKTLRDRVHQCPACKLMGDRDAVAAMLASFVTLVTRGNPSSAQVDYAASVDALSEIRRVLRSTTSSSYDGWQDTLSESNGRSARDGSFIAWMTPTPGMGGDSPLAAVARRNAGTARCSTRNETGLGQTTSERASMRTGMSPRYGPPRAHLRDNS